MRGGAHRAVGAEAGFSGLPCPSPEEGEAEGSEILGVLAPFRLPHSQGAHGILAASQVLPWGT